MHHGQDPGPDESGCGELKHSATAYAGGVGIVHVRQEGRLSQLGNGELDGFERCWNSGGGQAIDEIGVRVSTVTSQPDFGSYPIQMVIVHLRGIEEHEFITDALGGDEPWTIERDRSRELEGMISSESAIYQLVNEPSSR